MIHFLHGFRPFYAADGSPAGSPEGDQPEGKTGGGSAANEDPYAGWWASQLPREMREGPNKDAILALKGKGIGDVLGDLFAARSTLERAIVPPGKDATPEEMKAFLKKMDIPEDGNYGVDPKLLGDADKEGAFTASTSKEFQKLGLTKKQGQGVFNIMASVLRAGNEQIAASEQKAAETFDANILSAVGGDEVKAKEVRAAYKRALIAMAGSDKAKAKEFIQGLGKKGLLYDPIFAVSLATFYRDHTAEPPYGDGNKGSTTGKKTFMHHSGQFDAEYGQR